jgi:hypothetical protein
MIEACPFEMNGMHTQGTLNILPLGSYDVLIGMDWLDIHKKNLNFHEKTLECEDRRRKHKGVARHSKSYINEENINTTTEEV